jgi:hypothetical protein
MNKPDPDMFGRLVLTDLSSIYAEVARTRMAVELIARHLKIPNIDKKLEINATLAKESARNYPQKHSKTQSLKTRRIETVPLPESQVG